MVFSFPAYSALIADSLSPEDRGKGIAAMNTISNTLAIVAPTIAGAAIDRFGANMGMRMLYGVMMVLTLACTVIYAHFLKETAPPSGERLRVSDLPRVLRDAYSGIPAMWRQSPPSLRALTGVIILSFMANGVASPFWVVYAVEHIGLSSTAWGVIMLISTALGTLMFIPAGMLVDRWGRTASLLAALSLSLVSIPLFAFATSFTAVLLVRAAVAVAFATAIPACTALMADLVPRNMRGRVMAAIGQGGIMLGAAAGGTGGPAVGFIITIPMMIASLAGGYLYVQNPAYPWFFVLITTAVSIVVTALFIRDPQRAEI
jgi:MFS family permease